MNAKLLRTLLSVLLILTILAACAACGSSEPPTDVSTVPETETPDTNVSTERQEVTDPDEYILYQNVFYQDYGKDIAGTTVTKEGIFASVYDAYNSCQRYYVWGYYDQTKCCDWQWEFVPQEGETLPPVGSLVTVTGTFAYDESALDKYWIKDAHTELKTEYAGPTAERDMLAMSCTLERVQMYNILSHADVFEGQEFYAYGRIASTNTLQDPYYDGSWQIGISWNGNVPAIGTLVAISGVIENGTLTVQSLDEI